MAVTPIMPKMDLTITNFENMNRLVHTAENKQKFMYKPYVFDRIDPSFSYIENYFIQKDSLPPGSEE